MIDLILYVLCDFHTIAENLHDIHPHQTARPPVCAKKREGEILAMVVNQIPPGLHLHLPYYVPRRGDRG